MDPNKPTESSGQKALEHFKSHEKEAEISSGLGKRVIKEEENERLPEAPELKKNERTSEEDIQGLFDAIQEGQAETAKLLIDKMSPEQLSIQAADVGWTPLHLAAAMDNEGIAKLLLDKMSPEQLGAQDNRGSTALHLAAARGHEEIAKLLIDKMIPEQLVVQDAEGATALYWAANKGHEGVLKLLVDKMSPEQLGVQSNRGRIPLHLVVVTGDEEVVKFLLDKMSPEQLGVQDNDGCTPLHFAADMGHEEVVKLLLDKMSPDQLSIQDNEGATALNLAVDISYEGIAKLLLDKMSPEQLGVQDAVGSTALHLAADKRVIKKEEDERLPEAPELKKNERTSEEDIQGLFDAIQEGQAETAKLLIDKMSPEQLSIQAADVGWTPLHLAVDKGHEGILKLLLDKMKPEQLGVPDNDGWTPLHLAAAMDNEGIAKLLLDKMSPEQLGVKNNTGDTALHLAAVMGNEGIAKLLLDKMSPEQLGAQNNRGSTALHLAADRGHEEIAKLLIDKMTPEQIVLRNMVGFAGPELIASRSDEINKMLVAKKVNMVQVYKGNLLNFLSIESPVSSKLEGMNIPLTAHQFRESFSDFLKTKNWPDWIQVDKLESTLAEATQWDGAEGRYLRKLIGSQVPFEAAYVNTPNHALAIYKKNDKYYFCNEGWGTRFIGDKVSGVAQVGEDYIQRLLDDANKNGGTLSDAAMNIIQEATENGKAIRETDPQWIGNCPVASMRLMLREIFVGVHQNKNGEVVDQQGNIIPDGEKILVDLFKEFTLYQRVEAVKEMKGYFDLCTPEQQAKEKDFLNMAYAKIFHLALKRKTVDEVIAMAIEDFGVENNKTALIEFFKICLGEPENLPYDTRRNAEHMKKMKASHKKDFQILSAQIEKTHA